jgi:uncharacterized protein
MLATMPAGTQSQTARSPKPIDVGNGRLAASLGRSNAALLSVLTFHPQLGAVELSGLPPFDDARRGDPSATRDYRQLMTDDRQAVAWLETAGGLGVEIERIDLADPSVPVWHGRLGGATVNATAVAEADGAIVLTWRFRADEPAALGIRLRFRGRLDRPALAEITEIDPPRPTGARTNLQSDGPRLYIEAPALPAALVLDPSEGEWIVEDGAARLDLAPAAGAERIVYLRCSVAGTASSARHSRRTQAGETGLRQPAHRIVARALAYVRGCTCLRTAADERAILTDHRILPLSWTRDAYYQALLLLVADEPGDRMLVADHLRWLWRRCERPDGRWVRSHHANGRRKDRAFQADQQLYPIIELADFWRLERRLPTGVDWTASVREAVAAIWSEIDAETGLLRSAENAADDPAPAPFLCGSQIVLWYALQRLAELADQRALELDAAQMRANAHRVRTAFDEHLAGDGQAWAYAADGRGARIAYHDANDLPVALAPLWGLCPPDDAGWRATMAFAFSSANPGFYAGPRGGLGSRHTPGPWTLGDVQAWIRARMVDDEPGMGAALDRLVSVAFEDGMLPEAYTASIEPDVRIRHWFAWPGAALGALLLLDARGELARLRTAA